MMTEIKRFLLPLLCFAACAILLFTAGCSAGSDKPAPGVYSIRSYRDIPGVTADEIAAIEKLRTERPELTYGMIPSTEAFETTDGKPGGYAALFCEWLTGLFGIQFKLEILPTNELLDKLNRGVIDFSGNMMPSEERRGMYYMTDSIAERKFVAIRLIGSREPEHITERPPRYVFLVNIPAEAAVASVTERGSYVPVWANNYLEAYQILKNGEADAYITTDIYEASFADFDDIIIENFFPLIFSQTSMSTADRELLPIISVVNRALLNGATPFLGHLYNQGYRDYQKYKLFTRLNDEERAYINRVVSGGVDIPIAADYSNYPLSFYNERDREWQGLFFDLLGEISSLTGLSFRVSHNEKTDYTVLLEMLQRNEVVLFPDLVWTKERENFFIWSDTVILNDYYALISRSEYPNIAANEIKSVKIGLPLNTHTPLVADIFRQWFPDHKNIFEYNTLDEAFDALQREEIDMVMSTQRRLMFLTHYQETAGFKTNLIFDQSIETKIGFNRDETILRSIFDKALNLINIGTFSARWTQRTYDFRAKVMEAQRPWLLGAMILSMMVLALTLFFLSKDRHKNKRLEKLGQDLHAQGEQLKALITVSSILLEPDRKNFDDTLFTSLGILGRAMDIDHFCIWKNFIKNNKLYNTLVYEWSSVNKPKTDSTFLPELPYDDTILAGWEEKLSRGECISSVRGDLTPSMQKQLTSQGILSVYVIPVFVQGSFWGYLGCDGCVRPRIFTDDETDLLRSAGLLLSNAIIRNEMTIQLKAAIEESEETNRQKNIAMNSLERILDSLDAFIYITEPDTGKLLFVNRNIKKILNRENEDLVGEYCYRVLRNYDGICDFCPCIRLNEDPNQMIVWDDYLESLGCHARHSDCYIDWPNGKKVHLQHTVDITELIKAREQAEQSNKSKSVFLSHMSHEIRTPMNAILGITEIQLQENRASPETMEAFEKIFESGDLLLNLINDILDLSKIESGRLEFVNVKYEIPSLIHDTAQLNRLRYESKPIQFTLRVDEKTPHYLIGDELRIKQILNNILSNAFKYTSKGEVNFSVFAEQDLQNENITLVFRVSDTGQGMTKDQLSTLFDEYTRFNLETNRTILGAGLGMNITKRLIGLMNGEIIVESEPGKGTSFTVRLPQKRFDDAVCGAELVNKLNNFSFKSSAMAKKTQFIREYMPYGSVLVVDDVESNLYVAKGMMTPYSLRIETASRALEAIEKIKNGRTYDIVFMDHMMPEMDGIKATEIIRAAGYKLPIIALTANTLIGQKQMFLQSGFDGFISKPIDSRELDILLNEYIRNRKPPEVVKAARIEQQKQNEAKTKAAARDGQGNGQAENKQPENDQPENDLSGLKKTFVHDAQNAVNVLENLLPKLNALDDTEARLYVITVHGIKSALANIGEKDLSGIALKLEKAGRDRDLPLMSNDTPGLLAALKTLIAKLKPAPQDNNIVATDADLAFLRARLQDIINACSSFDSNAADAIITDLQKKPWPTDINCALDDIAANLLHSSFDKAAASAKKLSGEQ